MLTITGEVLDMYDDPTLSVLLDRHGTDGVREKFAAVAVPDLQDLTQLDDDAFGAVFFEKLGSERAPLRKWPVHEPGICAISVEYFHKVAEDGLLLPDEVRDQVACNITANADLFGLEVPDEMRKWATDHGEFLPDDNWVNLEAFDRPGRSMPKLFAHEKTAVEGTTKLFPLDDADCVTASIDSFVKEGWDIHGLNEWEARIAANHIVKAASDQGVSVPDDLVVFASLSEKSADEVHGALLSRIERVPVCMRDTDVKVASLHEAIAVIEDEDDAIKMAARVAEFDMAVGFEEDHYRAGLCRPEQVVFEPSTKMASGDVDLLDRIGLEKIAEYLGDDAVAAFEEDAEAALAAQSDEIRGFLLDG